MRDLSEGQIDIFTHAVGTTGLSARPRFRAGCRSGLGDRAACGATSAIRGGARIAARFHSSPRSPPQLGEPPLTERSGLCPSW